MSLVNANNGDGEPIIPQNSQVTDIVSSQSLELVLESTQPQNSELNLQLSQAGLNYFSQVDMGPLAEFMPMGNISIENDEECISTLTLNYENVVNVSRCALISAQETVHEVPMDGKVG